MADMITRNIPTSKILAVEAFAKDGELQSKKLKPVTIVGVKMNEEKALKAVREVYGKEKQFVITGIETTEQAFTMSVEDFMKNATAIIAE